MDLKNVIKRNLERMNYDLRHGEKFWKISVGNIVLLQEFKSLLPMYCKGLVLDAGAGHLLYKDLLNTYASDYESVDFANTHPDLTYIADIQNMSGIRDNRYNFVFSRNVLEHVPYPRDAMGEIHRVLVLGGYAMITVPHLAYLHNEPYDFWRFTKYSLRRLSEDHGFEIILIKEVGGLVAFHAYIFQTVLMGITYSIPVIGRACLYINIIIQKILYWLDKLFGMNRLFPLDYILIVKKV